MNVCVWDPGGTELIRKELRNAGDFTAIVNAWNFDGLLEEFARLRLPGRRKLRWNGSWVGGADRSSGTKSKGEGNETAHQLKSFTRPCQRP